MLNLNFVFFGNMLYSYINFLFFILVLLFLSMVVKRIINKKLNNLADDKKNKLKPFLKKIDFQITLIFLLFGINFSHYFLIFTNQIKVIIENVSNVLYILFFTSLFFRLIDFISEIYIRKESNLNRELVPILKKFIKLFIFIIAFIVILEKTGFDITSLVAGLGIGGLAFALAAKDILSNLFGGVSILIDKPFQIGQRIKFMGIDGFIDEIGIRTTKIKTLDGTQVIIPNAKFTDNMIENVSREESKKVVMNIGLIYSTTNTKINKAMKILKDIIVKNQNTKNEPLIAFNDFKESSLNILLVYYIENKSAILTTKNDINLEIKKQFEKNKIEFAYATQTIHVKR